MSESGPARKAALARRKREIVDLLEDFPRQYAALENAMGAFGEDFDLRSFKRAYETRTDMEGYNQVQAVERGLGRLQNYVAELSIAGARLAGLRVTPSGEEGAAQRAFTALKDAGVIDGALCRRLKRAQRARAMIEHSYVRVPAGTVHQAACLIQASAREFIAPYRRWIEDHL